MKKEPAVDLLPFLNRDKVYFCGLKNKGIAQL
jgi:hypothetical protein